jgi:hypothetical protein
MSTARIVYIMRKIQQPIAHLLRLLLKIVALVKMVLAL